MDGTVLILQMFFFENEPFRFFQSETIRFYQSEPNRFFQNEQFAFFKEPILQFQLHIGLFIREFVIRGPIFRERIYRELRGKPVYI